MTLPGPVVRALRCSVCGAPVELAGRTLRCPNGHSFDLARQGYVNLLHARVGAGTADTAEMVAARVEFLAAGHYAELADLVAGQTPDADSGLVVDAGAGTGYYLARVLDRHPAATGLALDVSALALRRAARAHERLGAVTWNLWEPWPVATGSAAVLLNVFAPRNGPEFHRVLDPGGVLVVVSPRPGHLRELASVVDLLEVDRRKEERLDESLAGFFEPAHRQEHDAELVLAPDDVRRIVLMGPTAHHPRRLARLDRIDEPVTVTASFLVSVYRPRRLTR
ncbi:MAG TPA: rRNA (guanine-N1)-methyltransferase [Amycolatopsis sp.]|nr:rRNA (guanine-N1)-methyltransferase [Amycolatopsis sp.]